LAFLNRRGRIGFKCINKPTAVSVSDKDILATVAPVNHMVIGARILYSQGSCHTPLFTHFIKLINFKDLTPLFTAAYQTPPVLQFLPAGIFIPRTMSTCPAVLRGRIDNPK
jgi:hypothetical protein